jgi:hypothetical protein
MIEFPGSEVEVLPGVQVADPTHDVAYTQQKFTEMTLAYPGELFTIESTQDGSLAVVWVPSWSVDEWVKRTLARSLYIPRSNEWPGAF